MTERVTGAAGDRRTSARRGAATPGFVVLVVVLLAAGFGGGPLLGGAGAVEAHVEQVTPAGPEEAIHDHATHDHATHDHATHDHATHDHGGHDHSTSDQGGPAPGLPAGQLTAAAVVDDPGAPAGVAPGAGEGGRGTAWTQPVPADEPARGLIYQGLVRSPRCASGFEVEGGPGRCTHGPDPAPPGASLTAEPPAEATLDAGSTDEHPAGGASGSAAAVCDGDGTSGQRVQVIYAYAAGVTPRADSYKTNFRQWANDADAIFSGSAAETGGTRNLRFVHDGSCVIDVQYVALSATGDDSFGNTSSELESLGFNRTDRKYLVFVEATVYCGIGSHPQSEASGPTNPANIGPDLARVDAGCWSGGVAGHEVMHTLGGVNDLAPNSSRAGHCIDEFDRMCYSDGGPTGSQYVPMRIACSDSSRDNTRFDCNHDDYYSTNPAAGSYLATHWNVASNEFLIGAPGPPGPPSNDDFANAIALSGASGSVLGTTAGATKQSGEASAHHLYTDGSSAWWTFTPSATGAVTIDLTGSGWETVLAVYTGSAVNGLTDVASDQTYPYGGDLSSRVTFTGTAGTTYRIVVAGLDYPGDGIGARAGALKINWTSAGAAGAAPAPPYGLVGLSSGSTNIGLSWIDDSWNETGFQIERAVGNGTFSVLTTTAADITDYADTTVAAGTEYRYRVRATNATGASAASNVVLIFPGTSAPGSAPAAPTALSATGISTTQIDLAWTDNSSNEWGFEIERGPSAAGPFTEIAIVAAGATTYADVGLASGQTLHYRVRATNPRGDSAYTTVASANTSAATVPGAPTGVVAVAGNGQATVSWVAPVSTGGSAITGYTVTSSSGSRTCGWSSGPLSCVVSGLTNGTGYTFTVVASSVVGPGPASSASNAVTPATVPGAPTGVVAVAGNGQATVSWVAPVSTGGSAITGYTVTSSSGSRTCGWSSGPLSCVVSGLANGTGYTFTVVASNVAGPGPASSASNAVTPFAPVVGSWYHPLSPARISDSRPSSQVGAFSSPWAAGTERDVSVAGVGGVPVGATAVALNVTVTGTTASSFLSIWPSGQAKPSPLVSSVNWTAGTTIPNAVTAKVGAGGQIRVFNAGGNVDVIIDVVGWYGSAAGDGYGPVAPARIADSRSSSQVGPFATPWGGATERDVTVAGVGGVPADADAVVVNVTVTGTTASSFLSIWPSGQAKPSPLVSSVNWTAGTTIPNAVTAKVGAGGQIRVFNAGGNVDVIIDVVGYFKAGSGKQFYATDPARVQDSRAASQVGPYSTPWAPGTSRPVAVAGSGAIPADAAAVLTNTTVTGTTAPSFLSVWAAGAPTPNPLVSSLNWLSGWTIPNAVTAVTGTGANAGKINVFNAGGHVDVIVDTVGYYR